MLRLLIAKELKNIFLSPKFVATFGVCSLLVLLSVFVGIQDYRSQVRQYETALQLADQQIAEETSWWSVDNKAYRKPSPLQIFVAGVNNDIGRYSRISEWEQVNLEESNYLTDSLFAVFRFIDLTFIFQVVLSLFAILFTYDAVNGERESGTLKLAMSNSVPRDRYVLSKFIGSWLGLTVPLMIPILIGILLVVVLRIPVEAIEWYKLGAFLVASILYFSFFIALGIFVSSLTSRSSVSFLALLVIWVALALIIPRAGTMAAGQLVEVKTVAEVSSMQDRFETDAWAKYWRDRSVVQDERMAPAEGMNEEERRAFRDNNREKWLQEDNEMLGVVQDEIADFARQQNEQLRNQKAARERVAFTLSRVSPSSAYQLTAMNLAGTNTDLKERYEDAMDAYRQAFATFVNEKRMEDRLKNEGRGRRNNQESEPLDLSELPRFTAPGHTFAEAIRPSILDFGILGIYTIIAFAGAFIAFLKYDVR